MNKKNIHLVLIHGFATNKTIWNKLAAQLEKDYTVRAIDLPGYGLSTPMLEQIKKPVIWVGWSLGGIIARTLAEQTPQYTQGIITLASNPKFVANDNWPCGINQDAFHALQQLFMNHSDKALTRFFTLQGQGLNRCDRNTLQILKKQMESLPLDVLLQGLKLLAHTDQREMLSKLTVPQLNLLGTDDPLVPVTLIEQLKRLSPRAQNVTMQGAGHVLLLSHVSECLTTIHQYINESIII